MKYWNPQNSILYGYCPAYMEDLVNLVLTYETIIDYDGELELIGEPAKLLTKYLSGGEVKVEDLSTFNLADAFILLASIADYHGFSFRYAFDLDSQLDKSLVWLDNARSDRKADCKRFLKILNIYFKMLSKNAPAIATRTIDTLANIDRLFSEKIIVSREDFLPTIMKTRHMLADMSGDATSADLEDKIFVSLICDEHGWSLKNDRDNIWFTIFSLNLELLESSYFGIPLHKWDYDLPLIQYKYKRGALYLPKFDKKEIVREAFSLFIPEIYIQDVPDLLEVRNSKEFKGFRKEVEKIYGEMINSPQDFPQDNSVSEYLRNKYLSQLEHFALERRPEPGTVLMRRLISEVHPIAAFVLGGTEVYKEYIDKYRNWKFAIATLEMKQKLQKFK